MICHDEWSVFGSGRPFFGEVTWKDLSVGAQG